MQTKNSDPADAATVQAVARGSEVIHDFLTGEAIRNPRGRLGLDHSGAPYGVRLDHSVVTYGGCYTISGWDRSDRVALPMQFEGSIWVKPGTAYQTLTLDMLIEGTASGTVTGTLNGEDISEAVVSGEQIVTSAVTIPVVPGVNQIRLSLDASVTTYLEALSLK